MSVNHARVEERVVAPEADGTVWSGLTRWEIAGAFGDIGVLFPIAIALITLCHMNPTAIFLTAGLGYVLAGSYFRIPMAVQPFKAVAAIALALQLTPSFIATAGLLMGALLLLIGLIDVVTPLARFFSLPIVRGIQLGLGLILVREGLRLALGPGSAFSLGAGAIIPAWLLALGAAMILLACLLSGRIPAALALLGAGVFAGMLSQRGEMANVAWSPVALHWLRPQAGELWKVLVTLVLPQFALTFGNSIVATENTAQMLYGPRARRVTARALSISIGLMNLLAGAIVGAPCCHGSGGITAHYKFGARTQKASYVIGGFCLLLALFGSSSVAVLGLIPTAVLGIFLVYVGVQHAALLRDIVWRPRHLFVAGCVGLVGLVTTNLTYGFAAGFVVQGAMRVVNKDSL